MAELVLALDYPGSEQALAMAREAKGLCPWVKVGLELFTAAGPDVVRDLRGLGFKVFLDLKFLDIPNTVAKAVASAATLGADLLTLHATGGERMLHAAVAARDQAASQGRARTLLLAVTVLTSQDAADLDLLPGTTVADLVLDRARLAARTGCDGVVCSGREVAAVKAGVRPVPLCLTPGIRPAGADDDQRRTMTPAQAVAAGADLLVVGRPITRSPSPAEAIRAILGQMAGSPV